ncbi:undecaprenyl-phosphate galactose phosphotransferase [Hydrogenivirga caldilitoris]|uniref:Undecaprenyl-phosphate galactose phosphotransferase n=1 Tax=Hydrogenivirga caldilitoris TaxID=246264 RepID=A0A497XQK8_9AQUI|nr:undecaprenyl-phosphate galactose phosphotransferase WbaP [Hydrogenivirga caldilitoris]RLJ70440.1 undecaprenyl-phosphate galactose phosphotransferase [Hydrogenivirga caldilitoris]
MSKNIKISVFLLITDLLAYYLSLVLSFFARKNLNQLPLGITQFDIPFINFISLWWVPFIFIFFIAYEKLYVKRYPFWDEARELLKALTIATVVIFAVVSLGKITESISRLTILMLWGYSIFVFPVFRLFGKKLLYNLGVWRKNLLIIGAGEAGKNTAEGLSQDKHLGYEIIGFLDDYKEGVVEVGNSRVPILGKLTDFKNLVEEMNIDTVVIAIPSMDRERLSALANYVHRYVRRIFIVPDLKGIALLNSELYHLFVQQLFLIKINNNLDSQLNQVLKRAFDLCLSILMLPALLPLIGIIGILIKLDSPGPIFFTHERIGRNGKPIKVIKFRSMYIDAEKRLKRILEEDPKARTEWEKFFKLKNDPRVTKIGKFLRKTSLDELPQIFNVLKGDMSLVGPRPVLKEELDKYYREYSDYYYMVRPGITGLWQVSGRSNTDYGLRVELDTWYVLNWSLWLDIVILFKTVKVVLRREGAY